MAMKKKFLGLALAAAVALPATSVYAAGENNIIHGVDTQTYTQNVKVSGSVSNKKGIAPAGKIEVELPTSMTFSVDEASNFKGVEYNVQNRSSVGVDVLVSEFRTGDGNITVKPKSELTRDKATLDRSNVYLELVGSAGGQATSVDLGSLTGNTNNEKVLNVAKGSTGLITLTGGAGTKEVKDLSNSSPDGVDKDGAKGDFTLVFKIQKDTKH